MQVEEQVWLKHIEELFARVSNDSLQPFRRHAWDRFLAIGLPTKKMSGYGYIASRHLYSLHDDKTISSLHFVDRPKGAIILPLQEAMRTYGTFLSSSFKSSIQGEVDPFALLNLSLHSEGFFLYIPPRANMCLEISHDSLSFHFPRLHVVLGKDAQLDLINRTHFNKPSFITQLCDFTLEEGATVNYFLLEEPSQAVHLNFVRAHLKQDSVFNGVCITSGGRLFRHDFRLSLGGENAKATLHGLSHLKEQNQAHIHVFMEHQKPNTKSRQLFKGVLFDGSRTSFTGKIYVHKEAQKTDAFQQNHHLLLSPRVVANSRPNLEIFADDVKASHGATVGRLDQESIFYLKSRGIPADIASKILVQGFCSEILSFLPKGTSCSF